MEGISRGRLNKMAGAVFQEGMRKVLAHEMYLPVAGALSAPQLIKVCSPAR